MLAATLAVSACSTLSFYSQSVRGQLSLLASRQDIRSLLKDENLDPKLRQELTLALEIRRYASGTLHLPDNESYTSFVDIHRSNLIWSVFAAPELSLKPRTWCFPFAGCVPYRGYFSEQQARRYAAELARDGDDIYVGGVAAYSTLGWFSDPVLSSMLRYGHAQLAALIFHELAHQKLYFKGDSAFNEAFAEAVGESGAMRWLESRGDAATAERYRKELRYKEDFIGWLAGVRTRLGGIYGSTATDEDKRARKRGLIEGLPAEYEALKIGWGGFADFDGWFKEPVNNARLAALGIYRDDTESFRRLLTACDGDYARFYQRLEDLKDLAPVERKARLEQLDCR